MAYVIRNIVEAMLIYNEMAMFNNVKKRNIEEIGAWRKRRIQLRESG
jgi:hypothetical protein